MNDEWVDVEPQDEWVDVETPKKNVLVKSIEASRNLGTLSPAGLVPLNLQELLDIGKVGIRQLVPDSGGLVGQGSRMVTGKTPSLPEPETDYGKRLELQGNLAQLAIGGIGIGKALKNLISKPVITAEQKLANSAYDTALKSREGFKQYAKDLSSAFGKEYEAAIGNKTIDLEDYAKVLEDTADEAGILSKDATQLSASEKKFLKYRDSVYDKVGDQETKSLVDVDSELKNLIGKSYGKKYGQGDHILDLARKNISDVLSEAAPDLKLVKAKYAPDLQFKNEAFKILKPYNKSGEFEAGQAINFFKKAALGKLRPDQQKLLGQISEKYQPGLLDDLIAKGRNFKISKLIGTVLKNTVIGTTLGAGGKIGYDVVSAFSSKQ